MFNLNSPKTERINVHVSRDLLSAIFLYRAEHFGVNMSLSATVRAIVTMFLNEKHYLDN